MAGSQDQNNEETEKPALLKVSLPGRKFNPPPPPCPPGVPAVSMCLLHAPLHISIKMGLELRPRWGQAVGMGRGRHTNFLLPTFDQMGTLFWGSLGRGELMDRDFA